MPINIFGTNNPDSELDLSQAGNNLIANMRTWLLRIKNLSHGQASQRDVLSVNSSDPADGNKLVQRSVFGDAAFVNTGTANNEVPTNADLGGVATKEFVSTPSTTATDDAGDVPVLNTAGKIDDGFLVNADLWDMIPRRLWFQSGGLLIPYSTTSYVSVDVSAGLPSGKTIDGYEMLEFIICSQNPPPPGESVTLQSIRVLKNHIPNTSATAALLRTDFFETVSIYKDVSADTFYFRSTSSVGEEPYLCVIIGSDFTI